ncbi:MAG: nucleotidyltransferase family protein [Candidatus Paceibacterota bacterium]
MKAIIVAGGKGTRLHPLTKNIPKPMIEVAGKPILEHTLDLLVASGIKEFIFTLCYFPKVITDYFGDGSKFGVKIEYVYEDEQLPLGTAGAIATVSNNINETFIVTYADILRKLDVGDMIKQHHAAKAFSTIHTYKRFGADPKSMIIFDQHRKITAFVERPELSQIKTDFVWANGSFYIFEPDIFKLIPPKQAVDFGKNVFPKILSAQGKLYAYPSEEYFIDIGNLEKLSLARKQFIPPKLGN